MQNEELILYEAMFRYIANDGASYGTPPARFYYYLQVFTHRPIDINDV